MPDEPKVEEPVVAAPANDELAKFKAELEKERKAREEEKKTYEANLQKVVGYFEEEFRKVQAPKAEAKPEEAPDPVTDPEKFRQSIVEDVARNLSPVLQGHSNALLAQNRARAASSLPNFEKYAGEIDAQVQKAIEANPQMAQHPQLYETVHKWVRAQHLEEEVESVVNERLAKFREEMGFSGENSDEEPEYTPAPRGQRYADAPVPVVAAAGNPTPRAGGKRVEPLDREEKEFCKRLGITAEQYRGQIDTDVLGFKGRDKI